MRKKKNQKSDQTKLSYPPLPPSDCDSIDLFQEYLDDNSIKVALNGNCIWERLLFKKNKHKHICRYI